MTHVQFMTFYMCDKNQMPKNLMWENHGKTLSLRHFDHRWKIVSMVTLNGKHVLCNLSLKVELSDQRKIPILSPPLLLSTRYMY